LPPNLNIEIPDVAEEKSVSSINSSSGFTNAREVELGELLFSSERNLVSTDSTAQFEFSNSPRKLYDQIKCGIPYSQFRTLFL
jgi:hypothetical protein